MNVGHYFCGLHLIVKFAEEANKALKSAESAMLEGRNPFAFDSSESGTFRLLRTACKAFEEHGSDEAGVSSHFDVLLKGKDEEVNLASWRGNRINIAFYNATALYYHKEHLIEFLSKWPQANKLLKSVEVDVKVTVYLAGVRVLGIVDKIITGPLWRLLESDIGILAMGPHYHKLQMCLQRWMGDTSTLIVGEVVFPEELAPVHRDHLYECIFREHDDEFDDITKQLLEIVCAHLLLLLERQVADQLPGGKHFEPADLDKHRTSAVPKTNIISERDFAQLDLQLRVKPSARIETHEALVMWRNNKTSAWLNSLPPENKKRLFEDARKSASTWIIQQHKKRQADVIAKKQLKLTEKQKKKELAQQKEPENQQELVRVTNSLAARCVGVWTSETVIDRQLSTTDPNSVKEIVLLQLKFHKLAGSKAPKQFYFQAETRAGGRKTVFDTNTLVSHLKEIVALNNLSASEEDSPNHPIREKEQWENETELEKSKVAKKLKEARDKRQAVTSKTKIDEYINDPPLLERAHRIKETDEDDPEWYLGTVKAIESMPKDKSRTKYLITYDLDGDDEQFSLPLITDLKRGDLVVL